MGHGTKDYGNVYPKEVTYRLDDMAELAVRQKSIVNFDRLGEVLKLEDFEDGLAHVYTRGIDANNYVELNTVYAKNGGFSAKFILNNVLLDWTHLGLYSPLPDLSKFGFEMSFAKLTNVAWIDCNIYVADGVNETSFSVRYIVADKKLQYLNNADVYVDFATGVSLRQFLQQWHVCKIVVDAANNVYSKFILNDVVYSLRNIEGYTTTTAADIELSGNCYMWSGGTGAGSGYIDDLIITRNEP